MIDITAVRQPYRIRKQVGSDGSDSGQLGRCVYGGKEMPPVGKISKCRYFKCGLYPMGAAWPGIQATIHLRKLEKKESQEMFPLI